MNVGDRIGDYEIIEVLGQGGMGQVYKVKNVLSERIEAMKVLLPNMEGDSDLAERFLREIKVQAAFDHPNIAKLYTALRSTNQLLMVMEFVEGVSLEKLLAKGPLLAGEAVDYASQVLDALAYAHGRGVVHRDIKPANIMLTPSGKIKLLDFGIAHMSNSNLTQVGTTVGSLFYMSPEQVKGGPADPRSDLYSLGIVLYEMVTGKRPFTGDSASAIMTAHLQQTPVAPNDMVPWVLGPLNEIILMAVAKDPQARFQSATAFRNALQNVAAKEIDQAKTQVVGAKTTPLPTVQPNLAQPSAMQPPSAVPSAIPERAPIAAASVPPVRSGVTQPEIAVAPSRQSPQPQPSVPMAATPAAEPYALPNFAGPSQPPAQPPGNRRGLYMALGSIVTLAVIAAAAIEGPKFLRTHAAGGPSRTSVQDTAAPSTQPVPSPAPSTTASPQNANSSETASPQPSGQAVPNPTQPEPATSPTTYAPTAPQQPQTAGQVNPGRKLASASQHPVIQNRVQTPSAPQPEQSSRPNSQQLTEVRRDYNDLAIRVNSAKESLRSIKEQMSSQGLGLRSDVREAETRMTYLLNEAKDKLKSGDAEGARHDLEMAQYALNQVEKFLGH